MDLYHSRLTQDDLNDLIIKYKISYDLHPQLPSEEFVMSELLDDVIVCINDNRSCIKHWKSGFFLIARLAILDSMLRDMPEGVLVLFGLSHVWKSHVCDPVLRGADGNGTEEEPHLDVRLTLQMLPFYCTPLAAADSIIPDPTLEDLAASTFGATSSHVSKRTRTAMAQSSGSTTRPSLFVDNSDGESDDDGDACIEIPLITPLCSVAVIPYSGNQGGSSAATLLKVITPKMSVLHYMMMSHGGDLLARYRGLNQSQYEYALSADSRLKGYKEKSKAKGNERKKKIKSLTKSLDNLHAEGLVREFLSSDEFSKVQGELFSLAASAGFERGLSMHQTKNEFATVLKKMAHFVPSAQDRLAEASPLDARVSPPIAKESTVTPASESLELPTNVAPTSSTVTSGPGNVVVPLSVSEKGDGSLPSSAIDQEAAANPSERTLVAPSLGKTDCRCVVVHPADPELLVFPSSLVGTCSLHDVVVHRSCLLGRRGSLCLLLRPHAKVFTF
ncbi:hypothetical protein Tco_0000265 [Tanacetum coccineum]